jgi:hypothetical protein
MSHASRASAARPVGGLRASRCCSEAAADARTLPWWLEVGRDRSGERLRLRLLGLIGLLERLLLARRRRRRRPRGDASRCAGSGNLHRVLGSYCAITASMHSSGT